MNDLSRYYKSPIYVQFYSHEECMCYKIDMPYTAYARQTMVLGKVSDGIEEAKKLAKELLTLHIENALKLPAREDA